MSLYIGNLPLDAKLKELQDIFEEYGPCKIKIISNFVFAFYDEKKHAEEAISNLQKKKVSGREINIEWSIKSVNNTMKTRGCYTCGSENHLMRNCVKNKERSRSRNRKRSKSRDREKQRKRSRSHKKRKHSKRDSRDRSRKRDKDKKSRNKSKRDHSIRRSLSRNRRHRSYSSSSSHSSSN